MIALLRLKEQLKSELQTKPQNAVIRINLQLFAGEDKTEKATPKKREDARKKGQVLQSKEIVAALLLTFVFAGINIFGGYIYSEIAAFTNKVFTEYTAIEDLYTINMLSRLFFETIGVILKTTAPIFAIAVITSVIASYAQVGFLFTTETLGIKFSRINPLSGAKRLFSAHAVVELLKSIFKIGVVGFIAYKYLDSEKNSVLNLMSMDAMGIGIYLGTVSINIAVRICVALVILGILDYLYQWWDFERNLKMSKQEVKEEYKMTEGNPEVKSKIKQKQRQISMRRMLHDVPKADVIITNPTHFAVAIKYDQKVSSAPMVIAKGQDFLAQRIKEVAKENNIEIIENKPLARTLYSTVDIGEAIPPDLYQAVAEVLAFVYSLKNK